MVKTQALEQTAKTAVAEVPRGHVRCALPGCDAVVPMSKAVYEFGQYYCGEEHRAFKYQD